MPRGMRCGIVTAGPVSAHMALSAGHTLVAYGNDANAIKNLRI